MIFPLVQDFADTLTAMPQEHPRKRVLTLLERSIRIDLHFLATRPENLFACAWNRGSWPDEGSTSQPAGQASPTLPELLRAWRRQKEADLPGFAWLRALRRYPLSRAPVAVIPTLCRSPQLAFAASGRLVVTLDSLGACVKVWDSEVGALVWELPHPPPSPQQTNYVNCLAVAPDGSTVVTGASDSVIRFWDVRSGGLTRTLAIGPEQPRAEQRRVRSWAGRIADAVRGVSGTRRAPGPGPGGHAHDGNAEYTTEAESPNPKFRQLCFSADGCLLAAGGDDNVIRLWDLRSGQVVRILRGHETARIGGFIFRGFVGLGLSPDGSLLVSGGWDGTVRFWRTTDGTELGRAAFAVNAMHSVALSPGGRRVAVGLNDGTVRLWDTSARREVAVLPDHPSRVDALAFSPDGRVLATGTFQQTIRLWDVGSGREIGRLCGFGDQVKALVFAPDGRTIASNGESGTVRVWDLAAAAPPANEGGQGDHQMLPECRSLSADGRRLATGSLDMTARVWDTATGECVFRMSGPGEVLRVKLSADGRFVAVRMMPRRGLPPDPAGEDDFLSLWDVADGREVMPRAKGWPVGFLGATAFTWSDSGYVVHVHDLPAGTKRATLAGHTGTVTAVEASPDGSLFLTVCAQDNTARVWDARTGWERCRIADVWEYSRTAFRDGGSKVLVIYQNDRRMYDAGSGRLLARLPRPEAVISVAFSPDGGRLFTATAGGRVCAWDLGRLEPTASWSLPLEADWNDELTLAVSPDGAELWYSGVARPTRERRKFALQFDDGRDWSERPADDPARRVAYSPSGRQTAHVAADRPMQVIITDAANGRETRLAADRAVGQLMFLGEDRLVTYPKDDGPPSSADGTVWDIAAARPVSRVVGSMPWGYVVKTAVSRDGTRMAVPRFGQFEVWDLRAGRLEWAAAHESGLLIFSLDGYSLTTIEGREVVRTFDAATGRLRAWFRLTPGTRGTALSPDGRLLAGVEDHDLVRLWDLAAGQSVATLGNPLSAEWQLTDQAPAPTWRPRRQPNGWLVAMTRVSDARPVTFFPITPAGTGLEPLPDGRTWYGFEETHLALYRLEGEPDVG